MALLSTAYGPFTVNELPEDLLIRVMKPTRAGGTVALNIYNQAPAYVATVSLQEPNATVTSRTTGVTILDPATLTSAYPDDFTQSENGWLKVAWQEGDFDTAGTWQIQVTLDNGVIRLKSTVVWMAEINAGPASAVT